MPLKVVGIERIVTRVPFRPHCAPYVSLDVPSLEFLEVIRLRTNASDVVGYGETPLRYTGRTVSDADVERAIGANPADLMFDDSLGIGRQMALLDAVGKANGIPIHGLLGHQERRSCPLAWWSSQATPRPPSRPRRRGP